MNQRHRVLLRFVAPLLCCSALWLPCQNAGAAEQGAPLRKATTKAEERRMHLDTACYSYTIPAGWVERPDAVGAGFPEDTVWSGKWVKAAYQLQQSAVQGAKTPVQDRLRIFSDAIEVQQKNYCSSGEEPEAYISDYEQTFRISMQELPAFAKNNWKEGFLAIFQEGPSSVFRLAVSPQGKDVRFEAYQCIGGKRVYVDYNPAVRDMKQLVPAAQQFLRMVENMRFTRRPAHDIARQSIGYGASLIFPSPWAIQWLSPVTRQSAPSQTELRKEVTLLKAKMPLFRNEQSAGELALAVVAQPSSQAPVDGLFGEQEFTRWCKQQIASTPGARQLLEGAVVVLPPSSGLIGGEGIDYVCQYEVQADVKQPVRRVQKHRIIDQRFFALEFTYPPEVKDDVQKDIYDVIVSKDWMRVE